MEARAVIADLRAGRAPAPDSLRAFALGLADGRVSDAQAGAFAMAACLNGLGQGGAVALTEGMRDSGDVLAWDLPGPVVDKHSTGGIGDPVSLVLAPALAALGCYVPMISGRGLGHTGGTLDKLEAIPGLSTQLDEAKFRAVVGEVGCAIVSATGRIAPADRRLYAIRDVTATVESPELIVASILSKKLAAGLGALVLDVKVGSGAFMGSLDEARALARSLVDTSNGAGCPTVAVLSDMNQPLAASLGNGLELYEVIGCLTGQTDTPLACVAVELGAELLMLAGQADDLEGARLALLGTLHDGSAAEKFAKMIVAMGGPPGLIEDPTAHLARAAVVRDVPAPEGGKIAGMDGVALGMAVVHLGGGRQVETDSVNPTVGLSDVQRLGQRIEQGDPLARVHASTAEAAERAVAVVQAAISVGEASARPLFHGVVR